MVGMASGYALRAPVPGDFLSVVDVVVASERAKTGSSTLGADFVGGEWSLPGFNLSTDAFLVTNKTGAVVGYAQAVFEHPNVVDSWGVVHPARRGRGLGTALFERIEQRARELLNGIDDPVFRHKADAGDQGAAAILRSHGLRRVRHFWHMGIELADIQPASIPSRITVTRSDPDKDLPTVHAIINEAMAGHWGEQSTEFESWIGEQRAAPGFDPAIWLLARYDGEPAGVLTASRSEDGAWIEYLGVRAAYRGRGVAGALLRRAFAAYAEQGLTRVLLNVDAENASGATAVYEREGMRIVAGWDAWERSF